MYIIKLHGHCHQAGYLLTSVYRKKSLVSSTVLLLLVTLGVREYAVASLGLLSPQQPNWSCLY